MSGVSREPGPPVAEQYGEDYFAHALGEPYTRANPTWTTFFGRVADFIVAELEPRTVLDVGCAIGFLVEALRDRGVDARGLDVSEYAIAQVPEPLKPYCTVASVTDEIDGHYDLITCIEVLEHLPPELAKEAIDNLSRHTDRIVFSSTPYDDSEPTHATVLEPDDWVQLFAARDFYPLPSAGTLVISPQAMVLERGDVDPAERLAAYESVRYELAQRLSDRADTRAGVKPRRPPAAIAPRGVRSLDRRVRAAERDARRHAERAEYLEAELDELRTSTWWRLGHPLRAAVTFLRLRARRPLGGAAPTSGRGAIRLSAQQRVVRAGRRLPAPLRSFVVARFPTTVERLVQLPPAPARAPAPVEELVAERLPLLRPLAVFPVPTDGRLHLTVLTDSLSPGSLFGGVGTSMILAATLARRLGATLRVVTRRERPDPSNFGMVLRAHEVEWDDNVEFSYSPIDGRGSSFPWRPGEIFLTTSWWSTWAALRSVDPARIVYLLQEDERLFYPSGDEQIACAEVLADPRIRFAVNTAMLYEYLVDEGFDNIAARGVPFEPAFPAGIYFREERRSPGRKRFFFYARPNNVRNLFLRGLDAVKESLVRGVLDPDEWELHFVGSGVPSLTLPYGVRPAISEHLPWTEYAALLRGVDVGLSLISSPHPSYPPLDLAACGAVAVTNRFGPKRSLQRYSKNIVCTDVSVDAIVGGIAEAAALAADDAQRTRNYESQGLSRSWTTSFEPLVDELVRDL